MQRYGRSTEIVERGNWWASPVLITLFVVGFVLFGIAAYSYFSESLLYEYDQPFHQSATRLHEQTDREVLVAANIVNAIPNVGIPLVIIGLSIWWIRHDRYRPAAMLFLGTLGQFFVFLAVGFAIGRDRPQLTGAMEFITLPSFPSGHVMTFVVFCTLALLMALPNFDATWKRWSIISAVFFAALLVGFLRLYLLAHWFTDIVAGYGLGLICAVVAYVLVSRYFIEPHSSRELLEVAPR
ncbi:MAG: phosphatase PAP2 family protein [Spirochaetales bacterium]